MLNVFMFLICFSYLSFGTHKTVRHLILFSKCFLDFFQLILSEQKMYLVVLDLNARFEIYVPKKSFSILSREQSLGHTMQHEF